MSLCFKSLFQTLNANLKTFPAIMKGVQTPVYARSLNNAVLFGTAKFCDRNIYIEHKYTRVFNSGCISGMVLSLLDTPSDLVKTQLQNQGVGRKENKMDLTNLQMTKKLYSLKGIPGLFQVNLSTINEN